MSDTASVGLISDKLDCPLPTRDSNLPDNAWLIQHYMIMTRCAIHSVELSKWGQRTVYLCKFNSSKDRYKTPRYFRNLVGFVSGTGCMKDQILQYAVLTFRPTCAPGLASASFHEIRSYGTLRADSRVSIYSRLASWPSYSAPKNLLAKPDT